LPNWFNFFNRLAFELVDQVPSGAHWQHPGTAKTAAMPMVMMSPDTAPFDQLSSTLADVRDCKIGSIVPHEAGREKKSRGILRL
jgi:hypothetical protein